MSDVYAERLHRYHENASWVDGFCQQIATMETMLWILYCSNVLPDMLQLRLLYVVLDIIYN